MRRLAVVIILVAGVWGHADATGQDNNAWKSSSIGLPWTFKNTDHTPHFDEIFKDRPVISLNGEGPDINLVYEWVDVTGEDESVLIDRVRDALKGAKWEIVTDQRTGETGWLEYIRVDNPSRTSSKWFHLVEFGKMVYCNNKVIFSYCNLDSIMKPSSDHQKLAKESIAKLIDPGLDRHRRAVCPSSE